MGTLISSGASAAIAIASLACRLRTAGSVRESAESRDRVTITSA